MTFGRWPRRPIFRLPFFRFREHDIGDELYFHLQGRIDELMAAGLSREEAEREAARRFGDLHRIANEVARIDRKAERRRSLKHRIDSLGWDLKLAARALTRRPAFGAVAASTLALTIGANTAVFSALRSVVLRPLAVAEPGRLMVIRQDAPALPLFGAQLSVPEVLDLNQERSLFQAVAGWTGRSFNLTGQGDPDRILGVATIGPFFEVFRVNPLLGRFYRPEASEGGDTRVAVVSHAFWRSTLGGDPAILGRHLELNGETYEIIGVLPAEMSYPSTGQVFVPYQIQERDRQPVGRGIWGITAIGRLQDGVPVESFGPRLGAISRQWHERYGGYDPATGHTLVGQPFVRWLAGELRGMLLALQAAVVVLLLIACANVGNLQLVRVTERERELAVRSALGAGGRSLVRQLLLESGLVALAGGVAGLALARAATGLLRRMDVPELRALSTVRVDGPVALYSAGVVIAAMLLFGLLPAWRARRPDLQSLIREGGRGPAGARFRLLRAGAVAQIALSLILVLGAASLVRSLGRLLAIEPGFHPEQVTTFRLSLPFTTYPEQPGRIATFDAVAQRLRALPGVLEVGFISDIPFGPGRNSSPFRIIGRAPDPGGAVMHADQRFVHHRYFQAMGIPLRRGRLFQPGDTRGTPFVAVIDQRLADQFFPGEDPVGQRLNQGPDAEIVGVVGSIKHGSLEEEDKATVYYHYRQMGWATALTAVVRTSGPPLTRNQLQAAVAAAEPRLPVFDVRSMQDRIDDVLGPRRLGTAVLSGFGLSALLLALLGVYGVLSYSVSRRAQELGIRLALGARPAALVRSVTASAMILGALGVGLGLMGFGAANRMLDSLVYGVRVFDPVTLLAGIGLLGAGVVLASLIPARRVVRTDPAQVLRQE